MISDLDIRRAANLLIRQHGEDVETEAGRRADRMLGRSDLDGNSVWKRIGRTIIASQASAKDPLHREIERPRK